MNEIKLTKRTLPERIRYIADISGNPTIAFMLIECADEVEAELAAYRKMITELSKALDYNNGCTKRYGHWCSLVEDAKELLEEPT